MINMFTEQSFRLPDEGKKFTTKEWEKPFREDHEDFKATMDERYKKAEIAICRSLMAPCQEKFLFQNESSQN
jgi:hypothetical protein